MSTDREVHTDAVGYSAGTVGAGLAPATVLAVSTTVGLIQATATTSQEQDSYVAYGCRLRTTGLLHQATNQAVSIYSIRERRARVTSFGQNAQPKVVGFRICSKQG